jgi:lipopolysaccharide/colanic/teichoic acid biosynthesis glycosyltransferase
MINVLRGEMSVVGPRPPVPYEYERYAPEHHRRLAVPPGITGLAQVRARGRASFEEMVAMDLEYIGRRSLRLDLAIMARTIGVVLTGRGAR